MTPESVSLSVHQFIELTAREGDMTGGFFSNQRAVDGTKAHKKVQATRPNRYEKEKKVERSFTKGHHSLRIEGRIDGIFLTDPLELEEIKTVEREFPGSWEDSPLLHRAQLLVYGGLYRVQPEETLKLTLTYYHLRSEKEEHYSRTMTGGELSVYLDHLLDKYFARQEKRRLWQEKRDASCRALTFPYGDFRPGQRDLSAQVFRAVRDECLLMVQAPTGTGKTMGTLFPAVKALGEGKADRVIYLTARTTGRTLAAEAVGDMEKQGADLITVILTGKEKICRRPDARRCDPEFCPFAEGYYDKLEEIRDRLEEIRFLDRDVLNRLADEYQICPFELSLDLGLEADILAADFNHLFDPIVSLKRFFARPGERYAALIDEAHNLPDRSRDMFTARLSKKSILEIKRALKKSHPDWEKSPLLRSLEGINRQFLEFRKSCDQKGQEWIVLTEPDKTLLQKVQRFNQLAEENLREDLPPEAFSLLMKFYLETRFFSRLSELFGSSFRFVLESRGKRDCQASLLCLHPAPLLKEGFDKCASAVLFSATLSPLDYFQKVLLETDREVRRVVMPSPFDPRHCPVIIRTDINTRYRGREESLGRLIGAIRRGRGECQGNHLVFFPSYRYLESARELWEQTYPEEEILVQTGGMDEEARQTFLNRFATARDEGHSLLAFAVMGGIFGEGIDLPGDLLTGVTVVGVGLPGIGPERDLLKEYYDELGWEGYDFAYRLPGWNRVLQAAGRVIRKESDRGIVQLIDDRFVHGVYRKLYPPHWLIAPRK
ncbi:MAG: ATP-dependent DNA helicase [Spirochaetales bacterium]|nr:ATP-dependent DNA helicase [Spirochaetales bacterium]